MRKKKEKVSGIYKIQNKINGKIYIGSSVDIKQRWNCHKSLLNKNTHPNKYLQNSWNKYNKENFEFSIVEIIKTVETIEEYNNLLELEKIYIFNLNSHDKNIGYNQTMVTELSNGRYKFVASEETKEKLKNKIITDEARKNMIKAHEFESIPIIQLDLNGNVVNNWNGAREASRKLNINQGCIWECLNKNRKTYKNFIWIHKFEYESLNGIIDLDFYRFNKGQKIEIIQLDLLGNVVKIWESATAISTETSGFFDGSTIIKVCKHKCYSSKNNIFLYYKEGMDYYKEFINHINVYNEKSNTKKIFQMDKNNNIIKIWNSIKDIISEFKNTNFYRKIECGSCEFNGFKWSMFYYEDIKI